MSNYQPKGLTFHQDVMLIDVSKRIYVIEDQIILKKGPIVTVRYKYSLLKIPYNQYQQQWTIMVIDYCNFWHKGRDIAHKLPCCLEIVHIFSRNTDLLGNNVQVLVSCSLCISTCSESSGTIHDMIGYAGRSLPYQPMLCHSLRIRLSTQWFCAEKSIINLSRIAKRLKLWDKLFFLRCLVNFLQLFLYYIM